MKDTIRYMKIIDNDVIDGIDTCVSLLVQGCPFHCKNCKNEQSWDFNGGKETNYKFLAGTLIDKIKEDDIIRNFSVLGGEPLCEQNLKAVAYIIRNVREAYKDIKIFVWTGNVYENLYKQIPFNEDIKTILDSIDYLIDGPYMDDQKNDMLFLCESENQRVIDISKMREINSWNEVILHELL